MHMPVAATPMIRVTTMVAKRSPPPCAIEEPVVANTIAEAAAVHPMAPLYPLVRATIRQTAKPPKSAILMPSGEYGASGPEKISDSHGHLIDESGYAVDRSEQQRRQRFRRARVSAEFGHQTLERRHDSATRRSDFRPDVEDVHEAVRVSAVGGARRRSANRGERQRWERETRPRCGRRRGPRTAVALGAEICGGRTERTDAAAARPRRRRRCPSMASRRPEGRTMRRGSSGGR